VKCIQPITIYAGKTQIRLFGFLSTHTFDWIAPETFDLSHDGHGLSPMKQGGSGLLCKSL
jgi:hypothetical protein